MTAELLRCPLALPSESIFRLGAELVGAELCSRLENDLWARQPRRPPILEISRLVDEAIWPWGAVLHGMGRAANSIHGEKAWVAELDSSTRLVTRSPILESNHLKLVVQWMTDSLFASYDPGVDVIVGTVLKVDMARGSLQPGSVNLWPHPMKMLSTLVSGAVGYPG
jgi:hypothetical protein